MKSINSRQNPEVKALFALKKTKERQKQGKFIAEGLRTCKTLIESGYQLIQIYSTEQMAESAQKLTSSEKITIVSDPVMDKVSQASSPSGLLGVFYLPGVAQRAKPGSGLVLAEISNPGNMGTLIRTSAAMGFKSVVVIGGTDPWSHKVIQSSAGTIGMVDIFIWSWEQLLQNKGENKLVAMVARDGQQPDTFDNKNTLLVIGNEARGLPDEWTESCDSKITLSMPGGAESLNAAVAGSIALYLLSLKK